jgi:glutamate 5-kinase
LGARKRWIGQTLRPRATIIVDAGARQALVEHKRSLLPIGILEVRGEFLAGEAVAIATVDGRVIGRGLTAYDAHEVQRLAGRHADEIDSLLGYHYSDEVIHRDDMVIDPIEKGLS